MEYVNHATFGVTSEGQAGVLKGALPLSALVVHPNTARPPLAVAYGPEEVPPWDWTRGLSPWRAVLGPELFTSPMPTTKRGPQKVSLVSFTPVLEYWFGERPFDRQVEAAYNARFALGGLGGKPVPQDPLFLYPRLVRKHPFHAPQRDLDFPLYRRVDALGRVALKAGPLSERFAREALKTAQAVGLLDPYGWGDSLHHWHAFALEVRAYLDFLREYRQSYGVGLKEEFAYILGDVLDHLREQVGLVRRNGAWYWVGGEGKVDPFPYVQALQEIEEAALGRKKRVRAVRGEKVLEGEANAKGGLEGVALHLLHKATPLLLARVDWYLVFRAAALGIKASPEAKVSVRPWVYLELAALYTSKRLSFCPICGAPFVGRKGQVTCGAARCRQAKSRKERKEVLKR